METPQKESDQSVTFYTPRQHNGQQAGSVTLESLSESDKKPAATRGQCATTAQIEELPFDVGTGPLDEKTSQKS